MSARPVVWITRRLSDATLGRARHDYDVILDEADTPSDSDAIVAMSERVDAIVPCHSEAFDAATVARLHERLKIVANHSVGTDHCDTRDAMGACALDNLDAFFAGRDVPNRVDAG